MKVSEFWKNQIAKVTDRDNALGVGIEENQINDVGRGFIVSNFCDKEIFYKPESSSGAIKIKPLEQKVNVFADGVATKLFKDKVFKIPDFAQVIITRSGDVVFLPSTPLFVLLADKGWKDLNWLNELHTNKDYGWDELFNKANQI
jgi:hypothetical protein